LADINNTGELLAETLMEADWLIIVESKIIGRNSGTNQS
jgi:hypothetical protein